MGGELQAIDRTAADSLIDWWRLAGVEAAVGETARDWLVRAKAPANQGPTPPATAPRHEEKPANLAAFQAWLATAAGLPMDRPGAARVSLQGIEGARIMLLSDLPAKDGAAERQPIGGEDWTLAQRMLTAVGLSPEDAYIASLGCFHSPGARFSPDELDACGAIARDHIRLAKPERLLLFGDAPARALLAEPLARARGRIHRIEGVRTVATFHPRWLLQRPSDKALAWRDVLLLMSEGD
jgi:uracil-DNA glycosylase family 4